MQKNRENEAKLQNTKTVDTLRKQDILKKNALKNNRQGLNYEPKGDVSLDYREKVVILIPSLNPDERLTKLIDELLNNDFKDIIVVNDGSPEEYNKYFKNIENKIIVLKHMVNLGKGRALKTGFNEFLIRFQDKCGIITVDSDGQHKIEDITKVAKTLVKNKESLILGSRNFNLANVPFKSKYGNKITRSIFKFLTGLNVSDTQTGLRGIPTQYITTLMNVPGERFEFEMNMLMESRENNIDIIEEMIETVYIQENKSSHFNPFKDSLKIYTIFLKYIFSSIISFIVDIIIYKIIFNCIINYIANYAIIIATIIARIISSLVNYSVNKNTVFKSSNNKSIIKYYILCFIQMIISAVSVTTIYNLLNKRYEVIIKLIVDSIIFLINFKVQKEWVFRKEKKKWAI